MLFEETIEKYDNEVKSAVDELFAKAYSHQSNDTDLLLVLMNALKTDYPPETLKRLDIDNYQIGADIIGFRYNSFYNFINQYGCKVFRKDDLDVKLLNSNDRDYFIENELIIYLKFWETDLILRRLYNIARLARGEKYDWEYNQSFFNTRRILVKDNIQKNLAKISPKFNKLINEVYISQIRNAIAHSQYYLMYDSIILTNKNESKHYTIEAISFNDWEVRFHKNILLYHHLIRCNKEYLEKFQEKVKGRYNGLKVVFPEIGKMGIDKIGWVKYDEHFKRWYWNDK